MKRRKTSTEASRGIRLYARILRRVYDGDATCHEVMCDIGKSQVIDVRQVLRRLNAAGLIHIAGKRVDNQKRAFVWTYGPGENAVPCKPLAMRGIEMIAFVNAVRLLMTRPFSAAELSEEAGGCRTSILKFIREMRRLRMVYVGAWEPRPDSPSLKRWSFGFDRADVPRPRPPKRRSRARDADHAERLIGRELAANMAQFVRAA